jgi:XTP/dITP diphosphohydrolase
MPPVSDRRPLHRGDTLVFATHNKDKVREMGELLSPFGLRVMSASTLGLPEPEETGLTFEENAIIKAVAAATASGHPSLADDSGLAVDALGGEPGIYSARWAGPGKDFAGAMRTIEERLEVIGALQPEQRKARFVAAICLAWPDGDTRVFRGEVEGHLVWPPRGTGGFGYDPMFVPEGEERTFGEMPAVEKHAMSHRARALAAFTHAILA